MQGPAETTWFSCMARTPTLGIAVPKGLGWFTTFKILIGHLIGLFIKTLIRKFSRFSHQPQD